MVIVMGRECEGDVEGRNVRFDEEDRCVRHRVCRNKAFAIDLDPVSSLRYTVYSATNSSLLGIYVLLGPKVNSHRHPRCHEKDQSHVGDHTDISRSSAVMSNSTYYAPHYCPQVLSLRLRPPP